MAEPAGQGRVRFSLLSSMGVISSYFSPKKNFQPSYRGTFASSHSGLSCLCNLGILRVMGDIWESHRSLPERDPDMRRAGTSGTEVLVAGFAEGDKV